MTNYKIRKHMDDLMVFAKTLPGSNVYYREDWDTIYFDLKGKKFGQFECITNDFFICLA
ncbi:hypothetical protein [Vagococcus jeotgali]|uniref:hypothetical protein n=1 Tax=Vagococcus jeotgali TaxID=3109030 RepID=UPI002DDC6139|nr:hypothetical protein [Vagococcus sp. B2T-5]